MSPNAKLDALTPDGLPHETEAAMLAYDIPMVWRNGQLVDAMANPSHALAKLGMFRVNLSVWVGTLGAVGQVPLDEWAARGVVSNVVRFEPAEWARVQSMARAAMEQEVRALREYVRVQLARAASFFEQAEQEQSAALVKKGRVTLAHSTREAKRRLEAAMSSAVAFDLLATTDDLLTAFHETVAVLHDEWSAKRLRQPAAAQEVLL